MCILLLFYILNLPSTPTCNLGYNFIFNICMRESAIYYIAQECPRRQEPAKQRIVLLLIFQNTLYQLCVPLQDPLGITEGPEHLDPERIRHCAFFPHIASQTPASPHIVGEWLCCWHGDPVSICDPQQQLSPRYCRDKNNFKNVGSRGVFVKPEILFQGLPEAL